MVVAIILSGGTGKRTGLDVPKQYFKIKDRMIIDYSLEAIAKCDDIDYFCIVASSLWRDKIEDSLSSDCKDKFVGFANPGDNRQLSIVSGLHLIKDYFDKNGYTADTVLIHDAARPNITSKLLSGYIKDLEGHDGVMPVLTMKDTVYQSEDGKKVSKLLDRKKIFAGQAPEVFCFDKYLKANESLFPEKIKKINGSSEPAILAGMDVVMVEGSESNYKITTKEDLDKFVQEQLSR
jgi:2-C-methyl-D-erythritol 4-phosphate cytidylyltransferase